MDNAQADAQGDFLASLLGDFLDESGQLLERLNESLLQLDDWVRALDDDHQEACDQELMNEMFRSAHSIKGLSGMLGLDDINHLTHKIENVFDAARKNELFITGNVVELMFQAVDGLVNLTDDLKDPDSTPMDCSGIVASITEVLESSGAAREVSSQEDAEAFFDDCQSAREEAGADQQPVTSTAAEDMPVENTVDDTPSVEEEPLVESCEDAFANLSDEIETASKYISMFVDETELSLDSMAETLLAMEGGGSEEDLKLLLITSHRIKGSAASIGLNRAAKLAHLMEDLLQQLVDGGGIMTPTLTDAMLKCTDGLRSHVDGLKQGGHQEDQFAELATGLLHAQKDVAKTNLQHAADDKPEQQPQATQRQSGDAACAPDEERDVSRAVISDELRQNVAAAATLDMPTFVGVATFQQGLMLSGLKAQLLYEKLMNLGEVFHLQPQVEQLDQLDSIEEIHFGLATDKPLSLIQSRLRVAGVADISVELLSADSMRDATPRTSEPVKRADTTSVDKNSTVDAKKPVAAKVEPVKTTAPSEGAAARAVEDKKTAARPKSNASRPTETVRVDIERLDQLMNLAGQLVINKARFTQIGDQLKAVTSNNQSTQALGNAFTALKKLSQERQGAESEQHMREEIEYLRNQARRVQNELEIVRREVENMSSANDSVNDLAETIHQLGRVSDGIQQSVMDTRMVPIGPLFARFKRVVRDITRSNNKTVRLVTSGEKTELDKRMIDELGDPLIHMVRNSADHGIELPDVREAAGKPREGTVSLSAFQRGNSIIVQVSDDGKGLSIDGIAQKAVEKGIATSADIAKMSQHQIAQLVWEPGLSTAEKVTEVSGRGMGMDIVKSKIEELNGSIDLNTNEGEGTTITIKLPLTLAILPSLMVDIDGDVLAMPIESVSEIVSIDRRAITTLHGKLAATVRGRVVSLVNLDEIFSWNKDPLTDRGDAELLQGDQDLMDEGGEMTVVVVVEEGREIGLSVDRVIGEEDIVIKSMADNYRNVTGISGASILGDGRVSLILDIVALIDMAAKNESELQPA
ncbi:MAG: chemotaxis protein CheA [Planctomycetota bacterium]|nr:chemotaxis protein CheA [Planctomycetota bacterium]